VLTWIFKKLGVIYRPHPDETRFLARAQTQSDAGVSVTAAVLDHKESDRYFGVPLARRGIQPVYLKIVNTGETPYRLRLASLDPNYYPPLEAAFVCHYAIGRRLLGYGLLAWWFLPLLVLLPFKVIGARIANRKMNDFFETTGIGWGIVRPGKDLAGFVFTTLDEGTKQFTVRLQGETGFKDFDFSIPIPGLRLDHRDQEFEQLAPAETSIHCADFAELHAHLKSMPQATTSRSGHAEGDPLNLVMIGDFHTIHAGFGARWDETEVIDLRSCWKTFKAFFLGSSYRYSPISALYCFARRQDFSLQKARQTINQRLHLRLWITNLRLAGKPVWIGQISRDIGVRFTLKTWNLTTHKIDPNVDDARDYLIDDLMDSGRVSNVGHVGGVAPAPPEKPRHNLTGDQYFTDGLRAVAVFSESRTEPKYLKWQ
jgi:hypothetical protein